MNQDRQDQAAAAEHRLLHSAQQRFAAGVTVAALIIAGVEATTGAISDTLGGGKAKPTLVDNPCAKDPYLMPPTSEPGMNSNAEPAKISLDALNERRKLEKQELQKKATDFNRGLNFFATLGAEDAKDINDTNRKDYAETIRRSLADINKGVGSDENDGAQLFDDIVSNDTQEALKEAGIRVETARPNNETDKGTSLLVEYSDEATPGADGWMVQFVPSYSATPESSYSVKVSSCERRINELADIQASELSGLLDVQRDKIAAERIKNLLNKHPSLRSIHEKHVARANDPDRNARGYSAHSEYEALLGILDDREFRLYLRKHPNIQHPQPPAHITHPGAKNPNH